MVWTRFYLLVLKPVKTLFVKKIHGLDNLPEPPFIIASNHASYLDPFIIIKPILKRLRKKVHYIAKPGRWGHNISDFIFIDYLGCIPTDLPKKEFFNEIRKKLDQKEIIGIFPEGERSNDGKIKMFKRGIGKIVLENDVPVIPAAIKGSFESWPVKRKLPKLGKNIILKLGNPMRFSKMKNSRKNQEYIALKIEKEVRKMFNEA